MTDIRWTLDPEIDAFLATMKLPPDDYMQQLAAERAVFEAAAPAVADKAPSFRAERLNSNGTRAGAYVSLSDFDGQKLALLFGSFTCPVYRGQIQRFNEIHDELRDRYEFLTIYTREAHPEDGWQVDINHDQDVVYMQPKTIEERADIAGDCLRRHGIRMPVALDDIDDSINKAYSGSPERLYLIDAKGIVRHRSSPGPFSMQVIEDWYQALRNA